MLLYGVKNKKKIYKNTKNLVATFLYYMWKKKKIKKKKYKYTWYTKINRYCYHMLLNNSKIQKY